MYPNQRAPSSWYNLLATNQKMGPGKWTSALPENFGWNIGNESDRCLKK